MNHNESSHRSHRSEFNTLIALCFVALLMSITWNGEPVRSAVLLAGWLSTLAIHGQHWRRYCNTFPPSCYEKHSTYRGVCIQMGTSPFAAKISIGEDAIRFTAPWMLRPFHPPFEVPFADVEIKEYEFDRIELSFLDPQTALEPIVILGELPLPSAISNVRR